MADYIPRDESSRLTFMTTLAHRISENAALYQVPLEMRQALTTAADAFAAAFAVANNPATRTRAAIAFKDDAEAHAVHLLRDVVRTIRAREIAAGDLDALGLREPKRAQRGSAPTETPNLLLEVVGGRRVRVTLLNGANDFRPAGSQGAMIWYQIGNTPQSGQQKLATLTNKRKVVLTITEDHPPGTRVWFAAQWSSTVHGPGPMSEARYVELLFREFVTAGRSNLAA